MPSMFETSHYHSARRFLLEGQRGWALVIVGELLRSASGRGLALSLLTEIYSEAPKDQVSLSGSPRRGLGGDNALQAEEQKRKA